MHQWISSVNSYYYTYMIYHVTHERLVFPRLGHRVRREGRGACPSESRGGPPGLGAPAGAREGYLLGADLTLADFYLVPCTFSFSLTEEGKAMYPKYPAFCRWRETMEALPTCPTFPCVLAAARPIEHAREWAVSHRPKY